MKIAEFSQDDVEIRKSHFRIRGAAGAAAETKCQGGVLCKAVFLLVLLTPTSSTYTEDMWGWTAKHDQDGDYSQLISAGRAALIKPINGTFLIVRHLCTSLSTNTIPSQQRTSSSACSSPRLLTSKVLADLLKLPRYGHQIPASSIPHSQIAGSMIRTVGWRIVNRP